jgi:hypothetical protein
MTNTVKRTTQRVCAGKFCYTMTSDSPVVKRKRRLTVSRRAKSRVGNKLKRLSKIKSTTPKTRRISRVSYRTRRTKKMGTKSPMFTTKWQIEHQSLGIGPLKKGKLGGYHSYQSLAERKEHLNQAVKKYGALSVFRSLNALAVYNKNNSPEAAAVFKRDRDMIRDMYM